MANYGPLPANITPAGFDTWVRGADAHATDPDAHAAQFAATDALPVPLPAPAWGDIGFGGPALTFDGRRVPIWRLDGGLNEGVGVTTTVPPGWATYNIEAWLRTLDNSGGDVSVRVDVHSFADGDTSAEYPWEPGRDAQIVVIASLPAVAWAWRKVTFGPIPVGPGVAVINFVRAGGDAADTNSVDVSFVHANLVKVS